jgi:hypothetical protein
MIAAARAWMQVPAGMYRCSGDVHGMPPLELGGDLVGRQRGVIGGVGKRCRGNQ